MQLGLRTLSYQVSLITENPREASGETSNPSQTSQIAKYNLQGKQSRNDGKC